MAKANTAEDRGGALVLKAPGGSLRGLYNQAVDNTAANRKVLAMLETDMPHLVDLLAGMPAEGDLPAMPGSAITIFVRDGQLKWSANVKAIHKTFFGGVEDPLNLLGCINCALAMGECSQKDYTDQKPSGGTIAEVPH